MSLDSERREARAKILMVINAGGVAVTANELADNPALSGVNRRQIGHYLRFMIRDKEIRGLKGKKFAPLVSRSVATVNEHPPMYFVLDTTTKKIHLDVGGFRLPVLVE